MHSACVGAIEAPATDYIVLGFLCESSFTRSPSYRRCPQPGAGSVLALMAFQTEFSLVALIGLILLIGIVRKNAIMIIDFAFHAERRQGLSSREAIYRAALLRFRPIMMTTIAALVGSYHSCLLAVPGRSCDRTPAD
jgi:multidrug efflux pump